MNNLVNKIIEYEEGSMNSDEEVAFFQELIDTGMAWRLQGHYGRVAMAYLESGICHNGGCVGHNREN